MCLPEPTAEDEEALATVLTHENLMIMPNPSDSEAISNGHSKMLELIAEMNIPYTQLSSPAWEAFIHALNPSFVIPGADKLHELILKYAEQIQKEGLNELRGEVCGLAIDGAKILDYSIYAFILVHRSMLRCVALTAISDGKAVTISDAIHKVYTKCEKYKITISGICSDSAANLKAAIKKEAPEHLPFLLGHAVLRVACAAHTAQLAISDITHDETVATFVSTVTELIAWIHKRDECFAKICPCKVPKMIMTRWNTLCSCVKFLINKREEVAAFVQATVESEDLEYNAENESFENGNRQKKPQRPEIPPIQSIPDFWNEYLDPLMVIKNFTDRVEGDLKMQQDLFKAFCAAETALSTMSESGNCVAQILLEALKQRFYKTANILTAQLAWVFTPEGLATIRALSEEDFWDQYEILKQHLRNLAKEVMNEEDLGKAFIGAIFDHYVRSRKFGMDENPFSYWRNLLYAKIKIFGSNDDQPIPLRPFVQMVLSIINLPATEAMNERCFSQRKRIVSQFNHKMVDITLVALSTIKLSARFQRKYLAE
jgi:hypothetical protein